METPSAFTWAALGTWDWTFLALSVGMLLWGCVRLARGDASPSPSLGPPPSSSLPAWAQAGGSLALFATVFIVLVGNPQLLMSVAGAILAPMVDNPGALVGGSFEGRVLLAGFLGQLLGAALLLGLARLEPSLVHTAPDASDRESLAPDPAGLRRLAGLFAAALALMTAGTLVWELFVLLAEANGTTLPDDNQVMVDALLRHEGPAWPLVVTALYVTVGAPLIEEIGFRGMLYPSLRRVLPRGWAVAAVGILFGIIHGNLATLLPICLLGAWLCLVRDRLGLGACVALHMMSNAWSFLWLLRAPDIARHL